jgi:putative flippase GtrA
MNAAKRGRRFVAVAMLGFVLQISMLMLLARVVGLPDGWATLAAVAAAIVHNYFWHVRWTWADRSGGGLLAHTVQFVRFAGVAGAMCITANVAITAIGAEWLKLPLPVANLIAVALFGTANYAALNRIVFAERRGHTGDRV